MKIAVVAAMKKELMLLLDILSNYETVEINGCKAFRGKIGHHDVVLTQCGIGKVNSALHTQRLIELEGPDLIVNSGVAGSVDAGMRIGAVLVAGHVAYHDVWCGPGTEYGRADGCPLFYEPYQPGMDIIKRIKGEKNNLEISSGLICSGDKFISTPKEVADIKAHFPEAKGCDMESASIAQTCYLNKTPFMIVRVMSDMPGGGENISQYQNFWDDAPAKTFEIVKSLIIRL